MMKQEARKFPSDFLVFWLPALKNIPKLERGNEGRKS